MKTELLIRCQIPHSIERGKSTRKLWNNYLLNLHYRTLNAIHKEWKQITSEIIRASFKEKAWGHVPKTTYQVSMGFMRGKSTKRCDCDGMSLLGKWAIDLLVERTSIPDDDIYHVDEFRCVYLGNSDDGKEKVILQLTRKIHDGE